MIDIILPVDFSETMDLLLKGAVKFAKECNGKIHLIHVSPIDIGYAIGDMGFQYFPEVQKIEIEEELQQLHNVEKELKEMGVSCTHILRQGSPSEVILDYVEKNNVQYIVMGSHGRSGIYDVFVGSLTKELTKKSPIPVLVIPCYQ